MTASRTINRIDPPNYEETINPIASVGFIGLATDRASLPDFLDFVAAYPGVGVHATRIPFVQTATPETLAATASHLEAGARALVPGQPLGSIGYSCTSGTIAVGPREVAAQIHRVRPECPVATPIEAAVDALNLLGARRISLLMPYLMETAQMVADFFEDAGFALDNVATFDLAGDPDMNNVAEDSIVDAGIQTFNSESDALFISCTGWLTRGVIPRLERTLNVPVVTSNQALAWSALRQAGVSHTVDGQGMLFARH